MCSAATLTNILTLPLSSQGDFNKANLRQVMPNFHQHVSCPTRGPNTLDHCYSQFKNAYKARSLPAFGKSDHAAIFLTPEYKQRLAKCSPTGSKCAAKHRYKERIESHFQLNDSRRMWQGLRTICAFGNKSSAEVRADPSLADELNTLYGRFECNALPSSTSGSSRQRSENHVIT